MSSHPGVPARSSPVDDVDKRRHRRARARGVVAHLRDKTRSVALPVENLSGGGVFVQTVTSVAIGRAIQIDLVRPGLKKAISLSGRVVFVVAAGDARVMSVSPGVGIQFDPMPPEVARRLRQLLTTLGIEDDDPELPLACDEGPGTPVFLDAHAPPRAPAALPPAASVDEPAVVAPPGADLPLVAYVNDIRAQLEAALVTVAERDDEIARLKALLRRLRAQFG